MPFLRPGNIVKFLLDFAAILPARARLSQGGRAGIRVPGFAAAASEEMGALPARRDSAAVRSRVGRDWPLEFRSRRVRRGRDRNEN